MTYTRTHAGFTIVELMVSLAVAAILIGFALPAFNDFVDQRRMASRVNDFVMAVTYARSEAIRRGAPVSIQALAVDGDNEFGGGYCVVLGDGDNDCGDAAAVLRYFTALDGVVLDAQGGLDGEDRLTFTGRGLLAGGLAGGRIRLCSEDEDEDPGRAIDITATGRADTEELECHP